MFSASFFVCRVGNTARWVHIALSCGQLQLDRGITPSEFLKLQGFPVEAEPYTHAVDQGLLLDLAGNAFSGTAVLAVVAGLLAFLKFASPSEVAFGRTEPHVLGICFGYLVCCFFE